MADFMPMSQSHLTTQLPSKFVLETQISHTSLTCLARPWNYAIAGELKAAAKSASWSWLSGADQELQFQALLYRRLKAAALLPGPPAPCCPLGQVRKCRFTPESRMQGCHSPDVGRAVTLVTFCLPQIVHFFSGSCTRKEEVCTGVVGRVACCPSQNARRERAKIPPDFSTPELAVLKTCPGQLNLTIQFLFSFFFPKGLSVVLPKRERKTVLVLLLVLWFTSQLADINAHILAKLQTCKRVFFRPAYPKLPASIRMILMGLQEVGKRVFGFHGVPLLLFFLSASFHWNDSKGFACCCS